MCRKWPLLGILVVGTLGVVLLAADLKPFGRESQPSKTESPAGPQPPSTESPPLHEGWAYFTVSSGQLRLQYPVSSVSYTASITNGVLQIKSPDQLATLSVAEVSRPEVTSLSEWLDGPDNLVGNLDGFEDVPRTLEFENIGDFDGHQTIEQEYLYPDARMRRLAIVLADTIVIVQVHSMGPYGGIRTGALELYQEIVETVETDGYLN